MREPSAPTEPGGAGSIDDDLVFDFDAVMPGIGDRRSILTALHQRCANPMPGSAASALLVSVDGLPPLAREHGVPMANRVREEAYARITCCLAGAFEAGLLDEDLLLLLLEGSDARTAARSMDAIRGEAGRVTLGERSFPVTYSAAVTAVRSDDLPEAIVGRLCRALQRVMMSGGENTVTVD